MSLQGRWQIVPGTNPLFPLFLSAILRRSGSMATHTEITRKTSTLLWVGAAIIAVLFLAYQAGAFNHWVKEGKTAIHGK